MTTPQPPTISVSILARPSVAPYHADDVVFMVGGPGAGATLAPNTPSGAIRSLASATDLIGSGTVLARAVEAILDQVDTEIILSLTPSRLSALSAAITDADVTVPVDDGSLYATDDVVIIEGEQLLVTGVAGNDLTTTRGYNNTVAAAHEIDAVVDAVPRNADVVAALNSVRSAAKRPTILYPPGRTAGLTGVLTTANMVATRLEALAEELECKAVADAAHDTVARAITWAGNNTHENVMGVFNNADMNPPGAYWIGAALAISGEFGRAHGIEHARVRGVTQLAHALSHSPRASVATDVSNLVGAYLSVLLQRQGIIEIVGDTFRGVADVRKVWSVARVVDHLLGVLEIAGEPYIGLGGTAGGRQRIANALERAGRTLVENGELSDFTLAPHPTKNTQAVTDAGQAIFLGELATISPIKRILIELSL